MKVWCKKWRCFAVVFWVYFFVGTPVTAETAVYRTLRGKVAQVIDGDTVRLTDGMLVRYLGMDTPEMRRKIGHQWAEHPQAYAEEASRMNRLLVEGKTVRLKTLKSLQYDKYGRLLAYVFVGPTFVNQQIVARGLARLYTRHADTPYDRMLARAQRHAHIRRLGIWSKSMP